MEYREIVEDNSYKLICLIQVEYSSVLKSNEKREKNARSFKSTIKGTLVTVGTFAGLAATTAAVVTSGPFSVPALIGGSRVLATAFVVGGTASAGLTASRIGDAITRGLSWFNPRRITQ